MDAKNWADKVDRAAKDPERIDRRKAITPAFAVPRHRLGQVAEEFGIDLDELRKEA